MSEQAHSSGGGQSPFTPALGPRTSFTLSACATLATGAYLGASWLSTPWLGLPMGVWLLGAGVGGMHLHLTRRSERGYAMPELDLGGDAGTRNGAGSALWQLRDWAADRARQAGDLAAALHDRVVVPRTGPTGRTQPRLRIGLDLPVSELRATLENSLLLDDDAVRVEWVRVEAGRDDARDCRRFGLDALVRRSGPESVRIAIPEHAEHEAAWKDWSKRPPLGYASLFPTRIDPAVIGLGDISLKDELNLRLAMRLAVAGAVLGRSPARLRARDRISGRGVLTAGGDAAMPDPELARRRLGELAQAVQTAAADVGHHGCVAWQAAARATQAWVMNGELGLQPVELLRRVEAADRFLSGEPESTLRVAAARFAAYEDEAGMDALHRAYTTLRGAGEQTVIDPLPFIMSEIELGKPDPLTVGRVASGICLLWATASAETLEYLRADLIDDLRHAGGTAWRGKDGKLLEDIVAELDRRAHGFEDGGERPASVAA